tara:strand:+ start:1348 stop:1623 length:276 start_codon:yes stop_codon:yes gene_type:complete
MRRGNEVLNLDRDDIQDLIHSQVEIRKRATAIIHNLMFEFIPKEHQFKTDLGRAHLWDCDDSPFGYCAYNVRDLGSRYDSCIFCGEPDERK